MYKAGDTVLLKIGHLKGQERQIVRVRMFATDSGYYVADGEGGLYGPDQVELVQAGAGNPCKQDCDARSHSLINVCAHCLGKCRH